MIRKKLGNFTYNVLKKTLMNKSTKNGQSERGRHADTIIRNHVVWSMGSSFLIPLPIADIFAVSALQIDMIRQLCRVYDVDFAETTGKAVVSSLTSSTLARAGARSLVKLIPGIGTLIGGVTVSIFNGASTFALGEVFKQHFENGGTFLDFDVNRLKKFYHEKFEKGKKVAEQWRQETTPAPETPANATTTTAQETAFNGGGAAATEQEPASVDLTLNRLKDLARLRDQGVISEQEFEEMKRKLIEQF